MGARIHACTHTHNWLQTPCNYGTTFLRIFRERSPSRSCMPMSHTSHDNYRCYTTLILYRFSEFLPSLCRRKQHLPTDYTSAVHKTIPVKPHTHTRHYHTAHQMYHDCCYILFVHGKLFQTVLFQDFPVNFLPTLIPCYHQLSPFPLASSPPLLLLSFPLPSFQSVE